MVHSIFKERENILNAIRQIAELQGYGYPAPDLTKLINLLNATKNPSKLNREQQKVCLLALREQSQDLFHKTTSIAC